MQIKLIMKHHFMTRKKETKRTMIANAEKDVGKGVLSYTVCRNVNG